MNLLNWRPDRGSPVKLHIQIADYIKDKIACGEWSEGTKLPSQRALSDLFEVNRSTVVTAIEELKAEGILMGNTGGGTKVVKSTWNVLSARGPQNWNAYISTGAHQPNQEIVQLINQAEFRQGIIRMGSCEPSSDIIPEEMIGKVLRKLSWNMRSLGYEEPKGSMALRKELSVYLKSFGIEADSSEVLITSGALQALQLISQGLLHTGSVVYLEKPSYLYSLRTFQSLGLQLSGIPLDSEGIDIVELSKRQANKRGSMLFTIPDFHNPTGIVMSEKRRKELIGLCTKENLPIIEDDVYREIWFDEEPPHPVKASDKSGLVLYVGGMSKNLSPGLRLGWIAGPKQVIDRLADIKMQSDYGSSSLSQQVAAEMIASGLYSEHNSMLRKKVKERRDATLSALKRYFTGIAKWDVPKGGYFIWLRLNKGISMYEMFTKALNRNVLINPGDLYEFHSNQFIRISFSYASLEDIERGIGILSEVITEQYGI